MPCAFSASLLLRLGVLGLKDRLGVLDLEESGRQIGEKRFVLLSPKQKKELAQFIRYYETTVDQDMCIICVVGDLEWENVGFEAKALDAIGG